MDWIKWVEGISIEHWNGECVRELAGAGYIDVQPQVKQEVKQTCMYPLIVNLIKLSPWELVMSLWSFLWEDYSFRMQTVKMKVNQIQQRKRKVAGLAKASQDSHHVHSTWWVILPTSPYPTLFCQHKNYLQNKVGQLVTCGQSYTTSALVISDQMVKDQFTKSSHKNYAISDLAFRALAMLLKHNIGMSD